MLIHFAKFHTKCNFLGQSDNTKHGQWISNSAFNDYTFDCINRADVNPYVKIGTKPWQGNENCNCANTHPSENCTYEYRRCIGQHSDQCIHASSKFYT